MTTKCTLWAKNFVEISLSCTISEITAFLCFKHQFKMVTKNDGKTTFDKKHQMTLQKKNYFKNELSRTVSQINALLHFMQKFKMVTKMVGNNFGKAWQMTLCLPWWSIILLKLLYLPPFPMINTFLHFTQKFKMAAKNGMKTTFAN